MSNLNHGYPIGLNASEAFAFLAEMWSHPEQLDAYAGSDEVCVIRFNDATSTLWYASGLCYSFKVLAELGIVSDEVAHKMEKMLEEYFDRHQFPGQFGCGYMWHRNKDGARTRAVACHELSQIAKRQESI